MNPLTGTHLNSSITTGSALPEAGPHASVAVAQRLVTAANNPGDRRPGTAQLLVNQQVHAVGDRAAFLQRAGVCFPPGRQLATVLAPIAQNLQQLTSAQRHALLNMRLEHVPMPAPGPALALERTQALSAAGIRLPDTAAPHTLDVSAYLSNRLASGVVEVIKRRDAEAFFGGDRSRLLAHYAQQGFSSCHCISSNTSTQSFLMLRDGLQAPSALLVMTGMPSMARLRHQLLQLHYAGVDVSKIQMVGTVEQLRRQNTLALEEQLAQLPQGMPKTLFIGVRWKAMESLARALHEVPASFDELQAYQSIRPQNWQAGSFAYDTAQVVTASGPRLFATLRMPNGDLAGDATRCFLEAGFTQIVMCGAGGRLHGDAQVGDYVRVDRSEHDGQYFTLPAARLQRLPSEVFPSHAGVSNVTVDSPLVETTAWLAASKAGETGTVDVETAHIFKAVKAHAGEAKLIAGLFISDVVGEHPLEEKISVGAAYHQLTPFIEASLRVLGIAKAEPQTTTPGR